jgi:predicted ATPase with chaperone activity
MLVTSSTAAFGSVPVPAIATATTPFVPREPNTLADIGLGVAEVEALILKFMLHQGTLTGRQIAQHVRLPSNIVFEVLRGLKSQMLVAYKASAPMGDFEHDLTETGLARAQRWMNRCTFYGAAPVSMREYTDSVARQTVRNARPKLLDVINAFADLSLPDAVISQVGQAITAGRGLFLYGAPGNGKTSIAERLIRAIGDTIWIPRTITISGEIIRLFDPSNHEEVPLEKSARADSSIDQRWIRIKRPTVVVGGELTLEHLEVSLDKVSGILEAPLQMKSNCGALVIDDFGRQRVRPVDLLNRWIVPLEKGFDFQTLPAGRQIQVPFDQLLCFATNLAPRELVDEAFLRRIPYKVEVSDPTESQFRALWESQISALNIACEPGAVDHLLEAHYRKPQRGFRYCHVRDLLLQVKHFCEFHERPAELTRRSIDVAAHNYFAGL